MVERDDIIRMAVQAGAYWQHGDWNMPSAVMFDREDMLIRFAQLVAAHEREACAKVCISIQQSQPFSDRIGWEHGTVDCAYAIRARGNNVS